MEQINYGMSAPHKKGSMTTAKMMLCVILALIPAGIYGVWRYGQNAGKVILLTSISAVITEFLFEKLTKRPVNVKDCRSLLTGLIMSYCLPPTVEWYVAVTAGVICALIMQLSFHFFYRNVVSPVILTRLILMPIFTQQMSVYVLDGLTMATPMAVLKENGTVDTLSMILGNTGGCIGENHT